MPGEYKGVRPEQKIRKIDGHAQSLTHNNKADGLIKIYATTASLPSAADLPNGSILIDEQASELLVVVGGAFLAAALS